MELTNWIMLSLPALIHRCTITLCAKQTYRRAIKKLAFLASLRNIRTYMYFWNHTERLSVIKSNSVNKNIFIRIVHNPKDIKLRK